MSEKKGWVRRASERIAAMDLGDLSQRFRNNLVDSEGGQAADTNRRAARAVVSYTQATGKRPYLMEACGQYRWGLILDRANVAPEELPHEVFWSLQSERGDRTWVFPTEKEALAAADAAYERAVAEGAMGPIEGVA